MSEALLDLKNLLSGLNLERSGLALALVAEVGAGKSFAVAQMLREISVGSVVVNANAALSGLLAAFGQPRNNISEQEALEIMVVQIGQRAPFILCLEDFHEASLQRQDLWLGLANRFLKTSGAALLLTSRTPIAAPIQSFFLEPFSTSDLGAILESETGSSLPEAAIDWIASRARGNPLFALEFLKWLARLGFLRSDGQYWRWREPETASLPSRVEALIEQALQPVLAAEERANALLVAAFLGSLLEFQVWAKISGTESNQLHEIITALERYGIFRRQHFSHPLYREVLLNNYNLKNRDRIARDVLAYLRQNDPIRATELISWVKLSALEQYQIFENAVLFARSVQDHVLAARLHFKGVQFAEPQAQVPLLLEAAVWLMPYQLSETLEILEKISQLEPLNPSGLKLRLEVLAYLGRSQEALAQFKEIPEHVFDAKTSLNLEFILLERGGFDTALLSLWRTRLPSQISGVVARGVVLALLRQKDFDLAQEIIEHALKLPELTKLEHMQILFAKMQFAYHQHDYAQSVQACTDFIALLEPLQNHKFEILDLLEGAYQIRACAYSALGQPTTAVTDTEQSLVYLKALGHVLLLAVRQCELGLHCLEAGDHTRAAALLVEVRPVLEGIDQALYAYHLNRFRALYLWNLGDEKALQSARMALRNAQNSQVLGVLQPRSTLWRCSRRVLVRLQKLWN